MGQKIKHDYKAIKFGYASAEKEGSLRPDLLLQGFYDHQDVIEQARYGDKFLFLGYKGSGKSAIGQRLILDGADSIDLVVQPMVLKDFPFNAFGKVGSAVDEPESRYPTSWAWLILLRFLDSFDRDSAPKSPMFAKSVAALKKANYLPIGDFKGLVVTSSKNSFKAQIPKLIAATRETAQTSEGVGLLQLVEHLRVAVRTFKSTSQHIIIIDGLDDILTHKEIQYVSLAALLQEVSRINEEFIAWSVPAKVVLLCRTDLFELFPDANKNKVRRDSAVSLDWYHDTATPENSALMALADLRVQLATGDRSATLLDFLPSTIDGEPIVKALLTLTRHTPRDFLQLLESIQVFAKPFEKLTIEQVSSGMRHYSIEYFFPEIKDELVGVGQPAEIDAMLQLIAAMKSRDFKADQLKAFASKNKVSAFEDLDIDRMLNALYDRSAIGTRTSSRALEKFSFKFRNRNSVLGYTDHIILHRGIWKAMNVG
ncbi:P-loop ATPase, Sll1717 family [Rathayibacter sp. AY1C7]|uniref:P-loop ATPase, Sll1717 family n=1 Tax=Rathayibacter sp. AY1C7 TaxID=2080540 RepID=UPI0011AFF6D8|nr:hypothetical protein [Rathayibacter sp. AY1C7]